jgi:hypothetical protein
LLRVHHTSDSNQQRTSKPHFQLTSAFDLGFPHKESQTVVSTTGTDMRFFFIRKKAPLSQKPHPVDLGSRISVDGRVSEAAF